jgi:hypothetical protein
LSKYKKLELDKIDYRFDISNERNDKDKGYQMQGNSNNKKIIYKIQNKGFDKQIVDKMKDYYHKYKQNCKKIYLYKNNVMEQ